MNGLSGADSDSRPLILAANDRLARALREDLNLKARDAGLAVWRTPDVRSLRQWISDVWADSWPSGQLLSDTQMQALWLDAVERDRHGVISATACAREALEADRLVLEYCIDVDDGAAYSEEQRAWRAWRRIVTTRMREHDWLASGQLPAIVARALRDGTITAATHVQLAGFDETLPPASRALIEVLRTVTVVDDLPVASLAGDQRVQGCRTGDGDGQVRFVADQVRLRLASCAAGERPPRIVIAAPDPDARRAALEGALIEHVAPGLRRLPDAGHVTARAPWRWDSAPALGDSPLAARMLALVAIDKTDNPPETISRLLLGAWTWSRAQHALAAAADLALRKAGTLRISVRKLVDVAPDELRATLERLAAIVEAAPRRALPSAWAAHFGARLDAIDWPGAGPLSSASFQQVQELRRALAALGGLDAQTGPVDVVRARLWLREILKRRFEPRADHVQPVRIIAADDAAGIDCDLLIVMDADAGSFPGSARSTPFLPIERQRAAGVPQASPPAWLAHRRREVAALITGAREVLLVVPRLDERGGEVTPSPLFDAVWADAPAESAASLPERLAASGSQAVLPVADPVPAVAPAENLHGTAGTFERFATAPFFAFCVDRLGIEPLPEVAHGLSGSQQGKLVHDALAAIWGRIGDAAALRASSPAERAKRIREALTPLLRRELPAAEFGPVLVQLEATRLADVLGAWLALEAERPDDFRVLEHEKKVEGTIAGLPVSLRLDRIEQALPEVNDRGAAVTLVDYKTGAKVDPNGWREDLLGAPQLPLYATLFGDDSGVIGDIAFAHVADGAPEFLRWQEWSSGKRRPPLPHAGNFAAQREAWRAALETIAAEFLAGRADIDPARAASLRDAPLLALANLIADGDVGNEPAHGEPV